MKVSIFYLVILGLLPFTSTSQDFKSIVAFGDSFTDNGHIDGHGFNRDSNGKVWVEHLKDMLGKMIPINIPTQRHTYGMINGIP